MSINTIVSEVLEGILPGNHFLVESPDKPDFPLMVWEVETEPEDEWCEGAGYDQHMVTVFTLGHDDGIEDLHSQVRQAMAARPEFLHEGESGDGKYEQHPEAFTKFAEFVLRLPQNA